VSARIGLGGASTPLNPDHTRLNPSPEDWGVKVATRETTWAPCDGGASQETTLSWLHVLGPRSRPIASWVADTQQPGVCELKVEGST